MSQRHVCRTMHFVFLAALLFSLTPRGTAAQAPKPSSPPGKFAPGVSSNTIRFATVIAGNVSKEERDAMLAPLEKYFLLNNRQVEAFKNPRHADSREMAVRMLRSRDLASRTILLSRWIIGGPPSTWRAQLEARYRKEPVFALLGGIANGSWRPIHEFSEAHRLPCLFPMTDFPVISDTDWYTLYLSKGYFQEGEVAARYLSTQEGMIKGQTSVVQIVSAAPEGQALAAGFAKTWKELGQKPPTTATLNRGEHATAQRLAQLLAKENPAALLVWDGPQSLPALGSLAALPQKPAMVFLSSRLLDADIWTLPEKIRTFTFITYPFAFSPYVISDGMGGAPRAQDDAAQTLRQADIPLPSTVQKISALSQSMTQMLTSALMGLRDYYRRDNFLDAIDMMPEQPYPVFGRIAFGSGHRYASKGCFIVQLSTTNPPELVKRSNWIIP
jgi:hypothetical protein